MLKIMFEEKQFAGFEKTAVKNIIQEKGIKTCGWMFEKPEIAGKEYFFITEENSEIPCNLLTDKNGVVSILMFLGDYSETELVGEIVKKAFMISHYSKEKLIELSKNSGIQNNFRDGIENFLGEAVSKINEKQSVILIADEDKEIGDLIKWFEKSGMEIKKLQISLMRAGNEIFLLNGDEAALTVTAENSPCENIATDNKEEIIKLEEHLKNREQEIEKQNEELRFYKERIQDVERELEDRKANINIGEAREVPNSEELFKREEALKMRETEIEKEREELRKYEENILIREKDIDEKKANLEIVEKELRERIENTITNRENVERKDSGDGKIRKQPVDTEEVAKNIKEILLQKDDLAAKTLRPFIKILSSKPKIFSRMELSEELYRSGVGFNENDAMKKLDRIVDHLIKEPNKYLDKIVEFEVLVKGNSEYGDNFAITVDYRETVKRVIKEIQTL